MKILFILLLIILQSCNSGGGGSSNEEKKPVPPIITEEPSFDPSCDDPAATTVENGYPFHGKGYQGDSEYFLICSPQELEILSQNPMYFSDSFLIGADIELYTFYTGDYVVNPNKQFTIGTENHPFRGFFNGNGYSISDYRLINSEDYCGLFSYTDGATILNLDLEGPRISSERGICAPIIGKAIRTSVQNVSIRYNDISPYPFIDWAFVSGPSVAGFIGEMDSSTIDSSYSVIKLRTIDYPISSAVGFSLSMTNNSFVFNSFFDGQSELNFNTVKAGITLDIPIQTQLGDEESVFNSLQNVVFSVQSGLGGDACVDSLKCENSSVFLVDKMIDTNYFISPENLPMSNWQPSMWDFIESYYPYPVLK